MIALLTLLMLPAAHGNPLGRELLQIAPAAGEMADGETPIRMTAIAIGVDGNPISGASLRASSKKGKCGPVVDAGGGQYVFDFTPDRVNAISWVDVELKGKTEDKISLSAKTGFDASPPTMSALKGRITPDRMTADVEPHATVAWESGAPPHRVAVRVSSGELSDAAEFGDGRHKLRWSAEDTETARVVVVTAVDDAGLGGSYAHTALIQQRLDSIEVEGGEGALVSVAVGDREFGPVVIEDEPVQLPIVVPPGVSTMTRYTLAGDRVDEAILQVDVAPQQSLLLFPLPPTIPANPDVAVPVRIAAYTPTGEPTGGIDLDLTVSGGSITVPVHGSNGVYEASLTPPATAGPLTVTVAEPDSPANTDSITLDVVAEGIEGTSANRVARVVLAPHLTQTRITGVAEVPLTVITVDAYGIPVANQTVTLTTDDGQLPPTVTTGEDGTAQVVFTSGREPGLARLHASVGVAEGVVGIIQSGGEVNWTAPLPRSGTLENLRIEGLLQQAATAGE